MNNSYIRLTAKAIYTTLALTLWVGFQGISYAQEYTPVTRLGTNEAICLGGIETGQQLQEVFVSESATISQILADAGWQGDKADLDLAIANGEFVEKSYEPGTRLEWFAAKKKGVGVALPYREWQGDNAFEGFEVQVTSQCMVYTMVIPKLCCNLSLMMAEPVAVPKPVILASANGNEVTICTDSGIDVSMKSADGSVSNLPLDSNSCWVSDLPAGEYQFTATNPLCGGAQTLETVNVSDPVIAAAAPVAVAKTLLPFVGIFAGSETRMRFETSWQKDMEDSSGVFGVKAGLMKFLNPKIAVFGQLGYLNRNGINEGNEYPDDSFFFDIGVDRVIGEHGFIGGGLGLWNFDDSDFDDESYFIHGGADILDTNAQWYLEARIFGDDTDDISRNHMYTAGIRYLFR